MSWGAPWEGGSRIEVWDENQRLRTRGFLEHGDASMVEYTLEARTGKTVLRLVHSGFAHGTDWEGELFGGTERGWRYELEPAPLRRAHFGRDRVAVWPRARPWSGGGWGRLPGRRLVREGQWASRGAHRVTAVTGDVRGDRIANDPPYEFVGRWPG
jgi:hypothetical protein